MPQDTLPPQIANLANQADAHASEELQDVAQPGPGAGPAQTATEALTGLLTAGRELAITAGDLQSPKVTLADDKIKIVVDVTVPVLEKYGFKLGGGLIPIELQAIFTAGPILWAATAAILDELAAKRAKAASEARLRSGMLPARTMADVADAHTGGPNG